MQCKQKSFNSIRVSFFFFVELLWQFWHPVNCTQMRCCTIKRNKGSQQELFWITSQSTQKIKKKTHLGESAGLPLPPRTSAQLTTRYHMLPPQVKNLWGGKMPLKLSLFWHDTRYHYCFFMIPELTTTGFQVCRRSSFSMYLLTHDSLHF